MPTRLIRSNTLKSSQTWNDLARVIKEIIIITVTNSINHSLINVPFEVNFRRYVKKIALYYNYLV